MITRYIAVQISKRRYAVAVRAAYDQTFYRIITKPIQHKGQCTHVINELLEKDEKDYSEFTKSVLFEESEELSDL